MRCKQCGYRLWNLPSRTCPECGTGFLPSEFEFTANSIQFCCPHCQERYYGTGENGHLVPIEFTCTGCDRLIHMDQMVLLPTSGIEEKRTQVDRVPWLDRGERGYFRAWFATIGMALVSPGRLIRSVPTDSSAGSAWWFATATNVPIMLMGLGLLFVFPMIFAFGSFGSGGSSRMLSAAILPMAIGVAAAFGLTIVGIAVWGLVTHTLLFMTGTTDRPIRRTYDALCYSTGANAGSAIPCVGFYLGWIWWLVSAIVMVKESQRVGGWRAALSVLAFPVGSLATVIGLYAWFMVSAFSAAGFGVSAQEETASMTGSVLRYAEEHPEKKLNHAIEIVAAGYVQTSNLVAINSMTTEQDVPIGPGTLADFALLTEPERSQAVKAAVATIPEDAVAHRCGDFVFVHHGIDLNVCDPRLWIVVWSHDPDSGFSWPAKTKVFVGLCDRTVKEFAIDDFPARLAEQNAIRAELGLPPLLDPRKVRHKSK